MEDFKLEHEVHTKVKRNATVSMLIPRPTQASRLHCPVCLEQWSSAFLLRQPFYTAPHVVVTPIKLFSLLLHSYNFDSAMDNNVNICIFQWPFVPKGVATHRLRTADLELMSSLENRRSSVSTLMEGSTCFLAGELIYFLR